MRERSAFVQAALGGFRAQVTQIVRDRLSVALIVVLAVTFLRNLPLNDWLASADLARDGAAATWARYAGEWTAWNHLRTAAASLSFAALAGAAALAVRN